ncbi:MAG: hypothetical protein J5I59_07930 [Saprospiraceae bacterium]|nr:hypothetical protein [Saprospiraceae bacterium]
MFRLEDIKGLDSLKKEISTLVGNGQFPHTSLFIGPEGNEKLHLAYTTARLLLCENGLDGALCGQCSACKKSGHFTHPDILFSFPFIKKGDSDSQSNDFLMDWKALFMSNPYMTVFDWASQQSEENKIPNITAFECSQIIRKLNMRPYEARHKIMLIWMPEYLGKESNRLLKILEEPPEDTYIILVAEDTEKILNTILSRCQLFHVDPMQTEEIEAVLMEFFKKSPEDARSASFMARGNMAEALSLFNEGNLEKNEEFVKWLRLCYNFNHLEIIKWIEHFATYSKEVRKYILKFGIHFVSEMLHIKYNYGSGKVSLPAGMIDTATRLCPLLSFESMEELVRILDREIYLTERNCNAKMQLLYTSGKIHRLFNGKRFVA